MERTTLLTAVLIIILATVIGFVYGKEGDKEADNYVNKEYTHNMSCGSTNIVLLTKTALMDNGISYVLSQHIIFKHSSGETVIPSTSPTDWYGIYKIKVYPIVKLTCFQSKHFKKHYVELYYTTGGNCVQCEYYELYDTNGKLIGSDRRKIFYKITEDKMGKLLPKAEGRKLEKTVDTYNRLLERLNLIKEKEICISLEDKKSNIK